MWQTYEEDDDPGCDSCGHSCYMPLWVGGNRVAVIPCECAYGVQSCPDIEDLWERCQELADRFPNSTEINLGL